MAKIILQKGTKIQLVAEDGMTVAIQSNVDAEFNENELTIGETLYVYSYTEPRPVYLEKSVKEIRWYKSNDIF